LSEEEEDIPEIEGIVDQELELPMAETIRQLSNGTEGEVAPLCITYPEPAEGKEADFELKSGFLHHLPKFHGLNSEDPNKHLKEFQFVCGSMCPKNGDINILKMKAFPFSLEDRAKTWLFDLPAGHVNTWDRLKSEFLTKYFPASRITILRKQITGIQQAGDETFCSYYERFKSLVASCPSHGMKEESLLTYFYEGLLPLERSLLDAAAGGSFMDKTPEIAKELLANRALNYQQYEGALASPARRVNEVTSHSTLEDKVNKMSTLLSQVLQGNKGGVVAQACGVCAMQGHHSDQCPQLIENGGWESANAIGGFQGGPQRPRYDPYSNTYNPGWRDHPNFKWTNNEQAPQPPQGNGNRPFGFLPRPQVPQNFSSTPNSSSNANYDKMFEALTSSTQALVQGQQKQGNEIAELKKQMDQVVGFMSKIHETGKLPSTTIPNPKGTFENASVVTTRSGNIFEERTKSPKKGNTKEKVLAMPLEVDPATSKEEERKSPSSEKQGMIPNLSSSVRTNPPSPPMPFPHRFDRSKRDESEQAILETLKKVQINIPLLDAIEQIPKYAKFLKELCTTRRMNRQKEVVKVSKNVSSMLQKKLPPKCPDPGSFTIPCQIGNSKFSNAMLDLGASINLMPYSVYETLGLGELKPDNVIIQLADRSNVHPKGMLEDVLVQVNHLIFPADFYVLEMEESPMSATPLLLGRPFMSTARTKIDVYAGALTMEFDGDVIGFNIFEAMRYPLDIHNCFSIDVLDTLAQEMLDIMKEDTLATTLEQGVGYTETALAFLWRSFWRLVTPRLWTMCSVLRPRPI